MNRFGRVVTGLMVATLSGSLFAESLKIGVVDLQRVMQTATQAKQIQENLEKTFKPRRDKIVEQEEAIRKEMDHFKRDNAVMSANQKKDLEKKIMTMQQSFERDGQQYQQELTTAHNEAMEGFYSQIRQAVATVAQKEKYDLVLQKDAATFSLDKLDVTDQVMKTLK